MKLADMGKGMQGIVVEIGHQELELALMRLGLMAGDPFTVSDIAPMGGPMALQVRGGKLALRRSDARNVTVKSI